MELKQAMQDFAGGISSHPLPAGYPPETQQKWLREMAYLVRTIANHTTIWRFSIAV